MDSTELRLILLGLGIILVIGLYAWEKSKRQRRSTRNRAAVASAKHSSRGRSKFGDRFSRQPSKKEDSPAIRERQEPVLNDTAVEVEPRVPDDIPQTPPDPPEDVQPATGGAASPESAAAPEPPQVLAFHVVARVGNQFSGDAIMSAARDVGLVPGQMDIFHQTDEGTGQAIFSMANMVKPGTFPFSSMSRFESPGLVLFAQLPGPKHSLMLLDELLSVADRLAALLDGRVQDENRSPLTSDKIDGLRHRLLGTH